MSKRVAIKPLILFASLLMLLFFQSITMTSAHSFVNKKQLEHQKISLRQEIVDIESECVSIDSRIAAINELITKNQLELDRSKEKHVRLQEDCRKRLTEIYKSGDVALLEVLMNIKDFDDLLVRVSYLQEIRQADLEMLNFYKEEEKHLLLEKEELEQLKAEKTDLKRQETKKLLDLKKKMVEERSVLEKAGIDPEKYAGDQKKAEDQKKQAARSNSAPLGSPVESKSCNVSPEPGNTHTSAKMPSNYDATGIKFSGVASWYGNEFNGRPTASGEIYNENDFTCASRTLAFGTILRVSYGNKQVVVRVNDRGPFVGGRVLDLSKAAAKALGISGIGLVNAEIIKPR